MMNRIFEFDKAIQSISLKNEWDINQICESGIMGYLNQGPIQSDQPLLPLDPFEPFTPWKRRPMPQRLFRNLAGLN